VKLNNREVDNKVKLNNREVSASAEASEEASAAADFFAGLVIDELKRENAELRLALDDRECKLREAADAVREAADQRAQLAQRLEETEARAAEQAERLGERLEDGERISNCHTAELKVRVAELEEQLLRPSDYPGEDALRLLRSRLATTEDKCRRLEDYVARIRDSYAEAFGGSGHQ